MTSRSRANQASPQSDERESLRDTTYSSEEETYVSSKYIGTQATVTLEAPRVATDFYKVGDMNRTYLEGLVPKGELSQFLNRRAGDVEGSRNASRQGR